MNCQFLGRFYFYAVMFLAARSKRCRQALACEVLGSCACRRSRCSRCRCWCCSCLKGALGPSAVAAAVADAACSAAEAPAAAVDGAEERPKSSQAPKHAQRSTQLSSCKGHQAGGKAVGSRKSGSCSGRRASQPAAISTMQPSHWQPSASAAAHH